MLTVENFLNRAKKGFAELDSNRQMFEDCDDYVIPYLNTFNGKQATIKKASKQYDSTAAQAALNAVNTIQSNFTPPFTRWAEFKSGPAVPEKMRQKIDKELSVLTDIVFSYIDASNFATASAECYLSWLKGTGCLWLFEGDNKQPLNFVSTPISQMGLVEGKFGQIDGRFRKWKVKGRLVETTWPKAELSRELSDLIASAPDEEIEFIEGCYYDETDIAWNYDVVHEGSSHRLLSQKFNEEICFTPRWLKIPGFSFGIGPIVLAMMDIKTLNKLKEYMLRSAALNIFGVYTVAGQAFNPKNVTFEPASFIPVERNAGPSGPTIAPLPRSGDFQVQEYMIQDLKDSIRKFLFDNRLPQETPQPKTAFEIAQRIKEFQADIGVAYGRGKFEYIDPMFRRILSILVNKKLVSLPEGVTVDNLYLKINVVSPVAQVQNYEDINRLMQNMQMAAGVGGQQLVVTAYEIEKLPEYLSHKIGPSVLLRDEVDAENMQKMIAQSVAQMQQQKGAA